MNFQIRTPPPKQHGLTLVELLVVLSLVAVLSTVALRSVAGLFEERHYDANIQQLEEIERAVLGDREGAGFLGDIGRLPVANGDAGPANLKQFAELWDQNVAALAGIADYEIRSPDGDPEVRLGTGWRGPYLNLGINRRELTDGFANRFFLFQASGAEADDGDQIAIVQSLGADGEVGGTGFDEDFAIVFEAETTAITAGLAEKEADRWRTPVVVNVVADGGAIEWSGDPEDEPNGDPKEFYVVVRIYGPNGDGDIHTVEQVYKKIIGGGTPSIMFRLDGDDDHSDDTGPGIVHGAKVIRAYQVENEPGNDTAGKESLFEDADLQRKSPATHVVIDRFTDTITLTLYEETP